MSLARGLPGFLRRSLRLDSDDDDEDDHYNSNGSNEAMEAPTESTSNNNSSRTAYQNENGKDHVLPTITEAPQSMQREISESSNPLPPTEKQDSDVPVTDATALHDIHDNDEQRADDVCEEDEEDVWNEEQEFRSVIASPPPPIQKKPSYRETQFDKVLGADVVHLTELRKLGWNGIPPQHRALAWKLLLGYVPTNAARRALSLERKRAEYQAAVIQHYEIDDDSRTIQEQETLRQVLVDVPRTAPDVNLFRNERVRRVLARLLYIWAIRHPASSYVQGINDLVTPLLAVFLNDYYPNENVLDGLVMIHVTPERLFEIEADCYWCLTNLLAGIQDHYTSDQPGVQRMVLRLEELVQRIDADLCAHLMSVGIQFMQFAFKWMNCLLLREFSLPCVIRLWDTYISEGSNSLEDFHVYVCAAFLCQFSSQLQTMELDELFDFMQHIPTEDWGDTEIEILLSQAYVLSTLFGGSDAHLMSSNPRS